MPSRVRSLRFPADLDERVEAARGETDFGEFVRGALEEKLGNGERVAARQSGARVPGGTVLRDSASRPADSASPRASASATGFLADGVMRPALDAAEAETSQMYRCRACEFQARSPRAKCPWHPGKLVAS